jgi:N-acetyl-gamma-glutamyl-phosphate reductase
VFISPEAGRTYTFTVDKLPVAIVGASGYTGAELARILLRHPRVSVTGVFARSSAGKRLAEVFPQLAGVSDLTVEASDPAAIAARAEVVFSALPHGEGAALVEALIAAGRRVLDLSADFRLRDVAAHRTWYGEHHAPALAARAVYGLPELHRGELREATLVAVPGCYPTAAILAAAPLLEAGLCEPTPVIVDAKSGVSGAGRTPSLATHFSEAGEGLRPYKVAGAHRHTPEMEQELALAARAPVTVSFTPQLAPMSRGILACVYLRPRAAGGFLEAVARRWQGEPFVTVLPPGALPDTSFVRGSNRAHVAVVHDARAGLVLGLSAIDNLVKGAAGQAVQCLNLMMGWPETTGLEAIAPFP